MAIDLPIPPEKLNSKSISDRFWGSLPKQNYFARAKNSILKGYLDTKELQQIEQEYEGSLVEDFAMQWRELLEEITFHMASDEKIDTDEKAFFKEYIATFQIPTDEAARIYRTGARRSLMALFAELSKDWELSSSDMDRLNQVATNFGLKSFELESSIHEQLRFQVNARINDMLEDDLVTDDEWNELNEYCNSLNIELSMSPELMEQINQARQHWRLHFGELEEVHDASVKLKSNERAFFVGRAKWYENRKHKGETILKKVGQGKFIMTNERVLLLADLEDNRTVTWSSVLGVNRISSCEFELERARGKSPEIYVTHAMNDLKKSASLIAYRLFEQYA